MSSKPSRNGELNAVTRTISKPLSGASRAQAFPTEPPRPRCFRFRPAAETTLRPPLKFHISSRPGVQGRVRVRRRGHGLGEDQGWTPCACSGNSDKLLRSNPKSTVARRTSLRGRDPFGQDEARRRQVRNQAPMPGLRRQILRSRSQAAGLLALRREGRAEDGGSAGAGKARSAARDEADRARVDARAGGGDRPGRPLAQTRRAAGVPPVRLRRRRQDDARAPCRGRRRTARPPSPPSPARRRW